MPAVLLLRLPCHPCFDLPFPVPLSAKSVTACDVFFFDTEAQLSVGGPGWLKKGGSEERESVAELRGEVRILVLR
jgi:hypothetical protein